MATKQDCRKKCNNGSKMVPAKSDFKKKRKKLDNCDHSRVMRLQDGLLSLDYILSKVFRKDGPPLGAEFDSVPSHAFHLCKRKGKDSRKSHRACQENQRALKRRKFPKPAMLDDQASHEKSASLKKHGVGKGLMTVWRLTNPGHGEFPPGADYDSGKSYHACQENQRALKRRKVSKLTMLQNQTSNQENCPTKKHGKGKGLMTVWRSINPDTEDLPPGVDYDQRATSCIPASVSRKPPIQEKNKKLRRQPVKRRLGNKAQVKKKSTARSRKVRCQQIEEPKNPQRETCELALEGGRSEEELEELDQFAILVDDEELELKELQAGSSQLRCCTHFATNGLHGCSLCKDLLAKFPPSSVTMKHPLHIPPWDSSPELVKKLFKIFYFLSTYSVTIGLSSFTLDEFAQAFSDKDSMLLGKVNASLIKLLLSDVEMELTCGLLSHVNKNCKYRGLLHSVEHQGSALELWRKSLNSLTWIEIVRQVFIAAGFGSKHGTSPRESLNKEANLRAKYGLSPGTLKGELFTILSLQGNNGLKVSELAKSPVIAGLELAATTEELELLISSMLSSDITLFEKISSSAYRLRINSVKKASENDLSDLEDFGSVDDNKDSSNYSSTDDSGDTIPSKVRKKNNDKRRNNMLMLCTEIDESHPGEAWLLGLMEGEYSGLNIEEKLNALVALIDLVSAGPSITMEDQVTSIVQCVPNIYQGSGAKVKRSSAKEQNMRKPFGSMCMEMVNINETKRKTLQQPIDSLTPISKNLGKTSAGMEKGAKEMEVGDDLHSMQSIFLGSDRRYNRYWLFLGPCSVFDPGHKRIYFESSEDGHWEVIDTEEALCTLLSALDQRGRRESHLLSSLEKRVSSLCRAMSSMSNDARVGQPSQSDVSEQSISREDSSSAVSDVDNLLGLTELRNDNVASTSAVTFHTGTTEQQKQKWSRLQAFDSWMWNSFYSNLNAVKHGRRSYLDSLARCEWCHDLYWRDEKHCKICHTTFELDFDLEERYAIHTATCTESSDVNNKFPKHKVLSSQLQSLKAAIYAIESSMPEDAMTGSWRKSTHNLWVKRLRRTSTLVEFLQVLTDFVGAINEGWLYQHCIDSGSSFVLQEIIESFPEMPQTSSAIALWLVKLDDLIAPHLKR